MPYAVDCDVTLVYQADVRPCFGWKRWGCCDGKVDGKVMGMRLYIHLDGVHAPVRRERRSVSNRLG